MVIEIKGKDFTINSFVMMQNFPLFIAALPLQYLPIGFAAQKPGGKCNNANYTVKK